MNNNRIKDNEREKSRFKIHIMDSKQNVKIIDISSTGCHIETKNKYHLGDLCTLSIKIEDASQTTPLSGKVVWGKLQEKKKIEEEDTFEYGLAFEVSKKIETTEIIELIINLINQ